MRPELFRLFDVGAPAYFILLLTGFLFATGLGVLWARRIGQSADVVVDLALSMLLAGVVGSRLLHVLADGHFWDYVHLCTDPSQVDLHLDKIDCASDLYRGVWDAPSGICRAREVDCFAWAKFWAGGLTYYGGFIGAVGVAVWQLRRDAFPFWKAADMAGFAVPLGLAFGRMGCLLAGCCFGARTSAPWGLSFPPRSSASEGQFRDHVLDTIWQWSEPVHPTQIYESLASLSIAAVCLFVIHPRKRYDGQVLASFLVLYGVARYAIEVLRRDERGGAFGQSTSQLISMALIVAAAFLHVYRRKIARHEFVNLASK